jgi:CTP:molybdopterin cytidylyltransferase MocA
MVAPSPTLPVFVMCGRDPRRTELMEVLDPDSRYPVKALLPFLGKRVIDWQLEALWQSPYVADIYLIGLSQRDAAFDRPVHYVPVDVTADFSDKLVAGLDHLRSVGREPEMVVISSSDAPAVTVEAVNEFFEHLIALPGYDLVVSLVPEGITEEVFPNSGRVVARFRDHQVYPGELYALSPRAIRRGQEVIRELHRRRRQTNRRVQGGTLAPMVRYIARRPRSWPLILKFLLKRATLSDAEDVLGIAFGCRTKGVIIPDPGFGMDMDLPEDYERLKRHVAATRLASPQVEEAQ